MKHCLILIVELLAGCGEVHQPANQQPAEELTRGGQRISELTDAAPDAVVPFKAAIEEMEKVHHRGLVKPAQDHSKYRVGKVKAVSMGDTMGDKPPCPSGNATDETGHADIESVVARFRDTVFDLTPAFAATP